MSIKRKLERKDMLRKDKYKPNRNKITVDPKDLKIKASELELSDKTLYINSNDLYLKRGDGVSMIKDRPWVLAVDADDMKPLVDTLVRLRDDVSSVIVDSGDEFVVKPIDDFIVNTLTELDGQDVSSLSDASKAFIMMKHRENAEKIRVGTSDGTEDADGELDLEHIDEVSDSMPIELSFSEHTVEATEDLSIHMEDSNPEPSDEIPAFVC